MKYMIGYEWKKIFSRRFNVLAMLAGYILALICTFNYVYQESYFDPQTEEYVNGIAAFEQQRHDEHMRTEVLSEEYVTTVVQEVQAKEIGDLESDEAYMDVLRPNYLMLNLISKNYTDMTDNTDFNVLNQINAENGISFYERRTEKLSDYLNLDFSFGNYSEAEKEYWMEKEQSVQTPFAWGDFTIADKASDLISVMFYFLFVIGVCIAPVFASEYETGADALLLTTKYGKTRLILAKIAAAVLFCIGYTVPVIGLCAAVLGCTVGFSGMELPVQLWETTIPYGWSMGKAVLVGAALMLLVMLTFTLLTLMLSARCRSAMIALAIGVVVIIGPSFFPMSENYRIWNQINYLFPVRLISIKDILRAFNSYQFGSVILSYLGMIVIVYTVVSVLCLLAIRGGFTKRQ